MLDEPTQLDGDVSPLDVLLEAMREHYQAGRLDIAAKFAAQAAPYVHPRLQTQTVKAEMKEEIRVVAGEPLSAEEWVERYGEDHMGATTGPTTGID
jgi:hypothetical protein